LSEGWRGIADLASDGDGGDGAEVVVVVEDWRSSGMPRGEKRGLLVWEELVVI